MKKIRNIFVVTLVLLTVISMGNVAGTYAKYTSKETATDTARVAKWDVKFGNDTTFKFNLFDTILDSNGSAETDVKDGKPNENIIAPGTKGAFSIDVTNNSEVTADLFVSLKETTTSGIPLQYRVVYNGTAGDWKTSIADVELPANTTLPFGTTGNTGTIKIEWQWLYEKGDDQTAIDANDVADTTLGEASTPATVTIEATLRATQRD